MAQRVRVELEDDLDGGPAAETIRFGLGGAEYEIDLSEQNASALRQQFAPYLKRARKTGPGPRRRAARAAASRAPGGGVREWARQQGIAVSDRGRIPANVVAQYEAAAPGA